MASLLAVTLIKLGALTVLIPLLTIAVTAYFLPFGLGNPVVRNLVRACEFRGLRFPKSGLRTLIKKNNTSTDRGL
jgi:hypothetical protein